MGDFSLPKTNICLSLPEDKDNFNSWEIFNLLQKIIVVYPDEKDNFSLPSRHADEFLRNTISVYLPGKMIRRVNFSLPRLLENDNFGLPRHLSNVRRISVYFGEKDPFSLPCWEGMISVYGVENSN